VRQYVRRVPTKSGAIAVQVVRNRGRDTEVIAHVGSARNPDDLMLLQARADVICHEHQPGLFDAPGPAATPVMPGQARVRRTFSGLLWRELVGWWDRLGFDSIDDEVFRQVVLARIVEPVSKLDTVRVIDGLGLDAPSESAIYRCLRRCQDKDYRGRLAAACWAHVSAGGPVGLLLYDVTTLYFETGQEDALRRPGFSKERRLEPQILVGLLVDAAGFPLAIHAFEGNKAQTLTILPVVKAFVKDHDLGRVTVVADAGMLTSANLAGVEDAGLDFIVGSKTAKFPYYLDVFAEQHPDVDTTQDGWTCWWPLPAPPGRERRLIVQYRAARARADSINIDKQIAKATQVVAGDRPLTRGRFITVTGAKRCLNQPVIARAKRLAGYKGYVTNLPLTGHDATDPATLIDSYHQLFQVERSFRMSKTDLRARPIFHHLKDSIEAHLTIVFAALAISRAIQDTTGVSIRAWLHTLQPLRDATITINGHTITIPTDIPQTTRPLLRTD